ncbi:hypothetical protein TNCV_142451 [Trichonephila clavipes]|nr:hypothetical protein TNCV_142451 [Trichonephila clavipes]
MKNPAGLNYPIALSKKFNVVDDDSVYTAPIMADKRHFGVQSSENIIVADYDDENEMNNQLLFPHHPK